MRLATRALARKGWANRMERGVHAASASELKVVPVLHSPLTTVRAVKRRSRRARVPGRGLVYRDERFPTGASEANRSRTARSSPRGEGAKGREANARPKEHKWAVRQDGGDECSSKHEVRISLTTGCRAQRRERKDQTLTRGDPRVERRGEVSRGRSSDGGTHEPKGVSSEGPKNERAELNENLKEATRVV